MLFVAFLALFVAPAALFQLFWPKDRKGERESCAIVRVELKTLKQVGFILLGVASFGLALWFAYQAHETAYDYHASDGLFLGNAVAAVCCIFLGTIIIVIGWPEKKSIARVR
jgi:hypothetical protein